MTLIAMYLGKFTILDMPTIGPHPGINTTLKTARPVLLSSY